MSALASALGVVGLVVSIFTDSVPLAILGAVTVWLSRDDR